MTRLLACCLLALLLAGCAGTTELVRSVDEARPAQAAASLLVVGVSTDDEARRRYEAQFVAELQRAGIQGVASHTLIPTLAGLTMPQIRERMLAHAGAADAVLHVQLANLVPSRTWAPDDVPAEAAPASRAVGGVQLTINAPEAGPVQGEQLVVEIESNLYALPDRRLLWTAMTRTREANRVEQVARSHARLLIREMTARGLVIARKGQ